MVLHYIRYSVSDPIWCEIFNKNQGVGGGGGGVNVWYMRFSCGRFGMG